VIAAGVSSGAAVDDGVVAGGHHFECPWRAADIPEKGVKVAASRWSDRKRLPQQLQQVQWPSAEVARPTESGHEAARIPMGSWDSWSSRGA
jgi:hypothetical protein